jgi:predicted RNA-binding Zn-ribbon protein involved in translation (DUF1610 family)
MSNYPPGVSGLEYEIAGPDNEWEEEFECDNTNLRYVRITENTFNYCSELGKKIYKTEGQKSLKENFYTYASRINSMFNSPQINPEVIVTECTYVGTVLKESYRGNVYWECPSCGKTYEESIERDRGDNY